MKSVPCRYLVFWFMSACLILFRIGYDLKLRFYGDTIVVYQQETTEQYDYLLHLPKGYHDWGEPRPLIIFLHGAGEVRQDVTALKKLDLFHYANGRIPVEDFPFIVVSPHTPKHGWNPRKVVDFLDGILAERRFRYKIDPERIYLSGFSMGGFGTFQVASVFPDRFAAIVPVSGGGEPEMAESLLIVPTWAFHGDADDVVDLEYSLNVISAMEDLRHDNVRLTIIPGAGHGITGSVYSRPEIYRWMLE